MTELISQLDSNKRKVDFDSFDITAKEILSMISESMIDIAPEYQRQFRWSEELQSRFVESLLLGIPIPTIFMAANQDGTWELIDGVQRISTIIHFMGDGVLRGGIGKDNQLALRDLEKLEAFNGFTYDRLPKPIQLQFALRPLKITTISDKSDLSVRFDLFQRLNTGGITLTPQEIRACIHRGPLNELLHELAADENFKNIVMIPESNEHDGTREELVLKFFAYYHQYQDFEHSVVDFLNGYMRNNSRSFDLASNSAMFRNTITQLRQALPNGISRGRRQTPVNLYEAVMVGAALAISRGANIGTSDIANWIANEQLQALTTGATNSKERVKQRIEYVRDRLLGGQNAG